MSLDASKSGAAGEYLVLGELLRQGQEAYLAQGLVQPHWDIICIDNEKILRVQVKTIDWPNQTAVNVSEDSIYDYIIVVLLDRSEAYSVFVVFKKNEFDEFLSKKNPVRKGKKRTVNFNNNAKEIFKKYERRWWFKEKEQLKLAKHKTD